MSFAAASTMGKALVGVPVAKRTSIGQMRAVSGRRSVKVNAMAGVDIDTRQSGETARDARRRRKRQRREQRRRLRED